MSASTMAKVPVWFWIIAAVAVLWNLGGIYAYWSHVTLSDEALAALPEAQRNMYLSMPAWATAAFAIAVFGGVVASIALALRSRFAVLLFGVSLAAVFVQMFQAFVLANALAVAGASAAIVPSMIVIIAIVLLWFSSMARGKGWLQ